MEINIGYVLNELQKSLAAKHESGDADSTAKADKRIRQWIDVLSGIKTGNLKIGTRKPTKYPVWVTPEVTRGGFATGKAAAAPLCFMPYEQQAALKLGVPCVRNALFLALLSDEGLAWLRELLASRRYQIRFPEDAALFVVAWLHEKGREEDAAKILKEISQYAGELGFAPESALEPLGKTELVHRFSANDIRKRLKEYKVNLKIETQREAHQIWIPFMDRLVLHWLELFDNNSACPDGLQYPSADWKTKAAALVKEYEILRAKHILCRKYHKEKENLRILLTATSDFLSGNPNTPGYIRARHVVGCYVKAHGRPGEERLTALRRKQAQNAALPAHNSIANALADRLPASDVGLSNTEALLFPISPEGHGDTPIPRKICTIVRSAQAASIPELVELGIVPSVEIMAGLTPQLTAMEISRAYADEDVGLLIAETYKAFTRRRSLLLMDLSSQVRFDELPWVKPMIGERLNPECYISAALRLAAYAIGFFPGTVLPNPLVEQLNALYWLAGKQRPFLAELAADIFTGHFTQKFDDAAFTAAGLLGGTLYERYYGIDYTRFEKRPAAASVSGKSQETPDSLMDLVVEEYMDINNMHSQNFVVNNGMHIECAQIYTTHNLAALVTENIKLECSYEELACKAFDLSLRLTVRSIKAKQQGNNYLRAIKNAAYAWRQALFFLSLSPAETVDETIRTAEESFLGSLGKDITYELFKRLKTSVHDQCTKEEAQPFLGWISGPHWGKGSQ